MILESAFCEWLFGLPPALWEYYDQLDYKGTVLYGNYVMPKESAI